MNDKYNARHEPFLRKPLAHSVRKRVSTDSRRRPKQERARLTVEAILEATELVLVSDGYDKTTTNRIAEVAGVGIGSLYEYFSNKESIVAALIERHAEQMLAVFQSTLPALGEVPLPVGMRELIEASVEAHAVAPVLHKVLVEQVPRVGDLERIGVVESRIANLVREYLQSYRDEIRPKDLSLAAFVVVQAVESLIHATVVDRTEYLHDGRLVDEATALVLGYLVCPNASATS